ncbi:antitoxin family protein [Candidatus Poribacteria bacterium]|nr:antitoxin family protein [Candidatus Poribacteria bacterium]
MAQPKKIRATYKNGVIEPLDKLNLPEGQELELEFKVLPSATSELSKEEKRADSENVRLNERHIGNYR